MGYKICLVEDQRELNDILTCYLSNEGWDVTSFDNGDTARLSIDVTADLWILDIMLPGTDGFQLLKEIRAKYSNMPVIFISARGEDFDRIAGLELGCDDYLPKPFLPRELVIRARNILDKVYGNREGKEDAKDIVVINGCRIDLKGRTVIAGGIDAGLTSREFDMVDMFIKNKGISLSRQQILDIVWGEDYFGSDRVVDNTVKRLRKKLPQFELETIYGYGYRCTL